MTACKPGARPHQHLDNPPRIRAYARDHSWKVVVDDDGSICDRDVTPVPPRMSPVQVLAFLMTERDHRENRDRRESTRTHK